MSPVVTVKYQANPGGNAAQAQTLKGLTRSDTPVRMVEPPVTTAKATVALTRRILRHYAGFRSKLAAEPGMATAELALTFPVVILVIVSLALIGAAGMAQVQVTSAARGVCRSVAIGEDTAAAISAGERLLGTKGSVQVSSGGKDVHCRASRGLPSLLGMLGMTAHSEAVIPREDSW